MGGLFTKSRARQRGIGVLAMVFGAWLGCSAVAAGAADMGFVGMEIQDADLSLRQALGAQQGRGGIMVRDILPGGPGDLAGFQRGELIVGFEGVTIDNLRQVVAYMQSTQPGQAITFDVWRDGQVAEKTMTLGDWPAGWGVETSALAVVPRVGFSVVALTDEVRQSAGLRWGRTGVLVRSLEEDAPALSFGIEAGDLIIAVGRTPVVDPADVDQLLAAMGDEWYLLVGRDNQINLVGPGVGAKLERSSPREDNAQRAVEMVMGDDLLVALLADGPYVMDQDLTAGGAVPPVGANVDPLPTPRTYATAAEQDVPGSGLRVATLTAERQQAMRLRWASRGFVVTSVQANSAASRAGLARGHVITAINGNFDLSIERAVELLTPLPEGADAQGPHHAALLVEARNGFFITALDLKAQVAEGAPGMDLLRRFTDPE